ncbi:Transposase DDE domain-containing protein, partial [Methanophagales archaeon]
AKGVIDEYRTRWGVEVFFKEEKSYWYLNNLPSRKLNAVKCTICFNFIAYNLISIFKKTLSEKYQNVGIKVLRREVLRKNAIMYFKDDGFELEFNVKKTKEKYYEHIESINSFVEKMREKRDILDAISLSH